MKLLVAGKERETIWNSQVWQNISPWVKSEKNPGVTISLISFTTGPSYGYKAPERRKPSGTLNFTNADRPTLWMDIKDTLPSSTGKKRVVMRSITIGWGVYTIEEERGTLLFGN
jgi:hypothetical protein